MPSILELDRSSDNFFTLASAADETCAVRDYVADQRRVLKSVLRAGGLHMRDSGRHSPVPLLGKADFVFDINERLPDECDAEITDALSQFMPKRRVKGIVGFSLDKNHETVINLKFDARNQRAGIWVPPQEDAPFRVVRGVDWAPEIDESLKPCVLIAGVVAVAQHAENHPITAQ